MAAAATAVGPHESTAKEGTWDGGAQEKKLPSPMSLATARKVYGWYDGAQVDDGTIVKAACKLPHHFVDTDGNPGAASINGVTNALARLPQTEGLTDAERKTIEEHLRGHLPASDADGQGRWRLAATATADLTHLDPEVVKTALRAATAPAFELDPEMFRKAVKEAAL